MDEQYRIRVNLSAKEFEIAGSEEFVRHYYDKIFDVIKDMPQDISQNKSSENLVLNSPQKKIIESFSESLSFENLLNRFTKSVSNTDKVLVTGYYIQLKHDNFSTKEVKNILLDHGIKIENPSQLIKNGINTDKIILVGKGKYKVSQNGLKYINELMPNLF
jgi:hypothetical protein